MELSEKIEFAGEIIAIIVRKAKDAEGIHFFSPPEFSQQLGLISRRKDHIIKPHIHKLVPREVSVTQEVLHILSGRIEITLYNKDKKRIKVVELSSGDTILLASGGHGIKILDDARMLEVKQGPYSGVDGDKEHF
jgi:cupin fold WbuC family metalloprotein